MKLFHKIFLQVFLGVLTLALASFSYLLYESKRQNLNDIRQYEGSAFLQKLQDFSLSLEQSGLEHDTEQLQNITAVHAFRNTFGSHGGISRNNEELFNSSPYEYDYETLRTCREESGLTAYNNCYSVIQTVNNHHMMLFSAPVYGKGFYEFEVVVYKDVSDIYIRSRNLFLKGLAGTLLLLVLISALLYHGLYRSIRPLIDLKNAAASIACGAYGSRVAVNGKDEIAELSCAFNQMAEKIEEHIETISRTSEERRQLLGNLAHELKTPLTSVIGYADTLLTVRLDERRKEKALNYILNECRRLSRLSSKMLELTSLSSDTTLIHMEEYPIASLFDQVKETVEYRLREKELHLKISCTPASLFHLMDSDLMISLLVNLIDNACKASSPGSSICLSGTKCGISVRDFGAGIPEEELPRVTEAFYMVDKSRSRSAGGAGLGLALCSRIAELHGARLEIESAEQKGTCVQLLW